MNHKNYYHLLGVEPSATAAEIKSAYRKLSLKFHPDLNNGDTFLEEMFKQINQAHDVLADPARRAAYDATISQEKAPVNNQEHPQQRRSSDRPKEAELNSKIQRFLILEGTSQLKKLAYHEAKYRPGASYLTTGKIFLSLLVILSAYVLGKPSRTSAEATTTASDQIMTSREGTLYSKPDFHSRVVGKISAGAVLQPIRQTKYFLLVRCQDSLGHQLRGYLLKNQVTSAP